MRIAWISDHPNLRHVGQSRVTREICLRLSIKHEVEVLGFVPPGKEEPKSDFPFPVKRVVRGQMEPIDKAIAQGNYDVVIFSHDCWLFPFLPQLRHNHPHTRFIGLFTIDGHPFNPRWSAIIYSCDAVIIPSQYGVDVLKDVCPDVLTYHIPYGLSPEFYTRTKTSKVQVGNYTLQLPEFVVVYYGHNQSKKNLGGALYGWNKFAQGKDDVVFVMITHTPIIERNGKKLKTGYDVMLYTWVPNLLLLETIATDEQLSQLLSSSSALLFPSLGEGFGYPCLEAMACGCVPITTNFAAVTDFCTPENSILLNYTPIIGEYEVIRSIAHPDDIAAALERRYNMRGTKEERAMVKEGYKTANQFTWSNTIIKLQEVLEAVQDIPRQKYAALY